MYKYDSGKSILACALTRALYSRGKLTYVLDGDNVRHGLNHDLTFKPEDRAEDIRRIGEVAKLFSDGGIICMATVISPYRKDCDAIRSILPDGDFIEGTFLGMDALSTTFSKLNKDVMGLSLGVYGDRRLRENVNPILGFWDREKVVISTFCLVRIPARVLLELYIKMQISVFKVEKGDQKECKNLLEGESTFFGISPCESS
ncbi:hypothetical protein L1887_12188 [Cichorium endivia]|nr:hypothetical protein L1887_12188 [Cichorium endivia]